ncbi:hypothetical protein M3P21_13055 [Ruegeria sp. 2012CJ41-6]|uniref:Transferrin-binding protein B C-lobe/N-lobe beta barrel domain-containing protein n=1 Tax=Ruegeria spongiae TaxID=2942209 RepID=A0ABT0Q3K3_9RHOB|nr:hypothetical protein [Ruegeria spongiae]MCL6284456.1 hypothetical protein [Ruegeria spongiae]
MKRYLLAIAALSLVSACGSGVFTEDSADTGGGEGGEGTDDSGIVVPEEIAGEVESVIYNPGDPSSGVAPTLTLTGLPFDSGVDTAEYVRDASLDVGDFQAFTFQAANPSARKYTALVREQDGLVVVASGSGGFEQFFGGSSFSRTGTYTAPTAADLPTDPVTGGPGNIGSVEYTGTYAGILNVGLTGGGNESQARMSGDVVVVGDFRDQTNVIGEINNRQFEDTFNVVNGVNDSDPNRPGGDPDDIRIVGADTATMPGDLTAVEDLIFTATTLNADGSFNGNLKNANGSYAGAFTGEAATAVGGAIRAEGHISELPSIDGTPIFEHGVFTATR